MTSRLIYLNLSTNTLVEPRGTLAKSGAKMDALMRPIAHVPSSLSNLVSLSLTLMPSIYPYPEALYRILPTEDVPHVHMECQRFITDIELLSYSPILRSKWDPKTIPPTPHEVEGSLLLGHWHIHHLE
jgi:hypothetical protein